MQERTRRDILRAYNTLIKKSSMERITIDQLVKEAGISRATFYRYFKDKYDVMNYNYKILLDSMGTPEKSNSYKDLYRNLYKYGQKNWKFLQNAFETTGRNSFGEYIETYSMQLVEQITMHNRGGSGLTETEKLQCDVFIRGIPYMYRKWIFEKYTLSPDEAAQALYEIMPATLRDLWW